MTVWASRGTSGAASAQGRRWLRPEVVLVEPGPEVERESILGVGSLTVPGLVGTDDAGRGGDRSTVKPATTRPTAEGLSSLPWSSRQASSEVSFARWDELRAGMDEVGVVADDLAVEAYHRGQARATSASVAAAPRCRSAIDHRLSPRRTVTVSRAAAPGRATARADARRPRRGWGRSGRSEARTPSRRGRGIAGTGGGGRAVTGRGLRCRAEARAGHRRGVGPDRGSSAEVTALRSGRPGLADRVHRGRCRSVPCGCRRPPDGQRLRHQLQRSSGRRGRPLRVGAATVPTTAAGGSARDTVDVPSAAVSSRRTSRGVRWSARRSTIAPRRRGGSEQGEGRAEGEPARQHQAGPGEHDDEHLIRALTRRRPGIAAGRRRGRHRQQHRDRDEREAEADRGLQVRLGDRRCACMWSFNAVCLCLVKYESDQTVDGADGPLATTATTRKGGRMRWSGSSTTSRRSSRRTTRTTARRRSPTARAVNGPHRPPCPVARQQWRVLGWWIAGQALTAHVTDVGPDWVLVEPAPGRPVLLRLGAVRSVSGLRRGAQTPSVVARRFTIGLALGAISRDRAPWRSETSTAGRSSAPSTSSGRTTSRSRSTRPTSHDGRRTSPPSRSCPSPRSPGCDAFVHCRPRADRGAGHPRPSPRSGWASTKDRVSAYIRWM